MVTSDPTWQSRLDDALPELEPILRARFTALGPEGCEEAMQEAVSYIAETMARKPRLQPFQILRFAIRRFLSGRRMAGDCTRSIDSPFSIAHGRGTRDRNTMAWDGEEYIDAIEAIVGPDDDPAKTVPCKIDFRDFRFSLSPKKAGIVDLAIEGETTRAIARIVNVSCARVSQVKREAYDRWFTYCRL